MHAWATFNRHAGGTCATTPRLPHLAAATPLAPARPCTAYGSLLYMVRLTPGTCGGVPGIRRWQRALRIRRGAQRNLHLERRGQPGSMKLLPTPHLHTCTRLFHSALLPHTYPVGCLLCGRSISTHDHRARRSNGIILARAPTPSWKKEEEGALTPERVSGRRYSGDHHLRTYHGMWRRSDIVTRESIWWGMAFRFHCVALTSSPTFPHYHCTPPSHPYHTPHLTHSTPWLLTSPSSFPHLPLPCTSPLHTLHLCKTLRTAPARRARILAAPASPLLTHLSRAAPEWIDRIGWHASAPLTAPKTATFPRNRLARSRAYGTLLCMHLTLHHAYRATCCHSLCRYSTRLHSNGAAFAAAATKARHVLISYIGQRIVDGMG